MANKIQTSDIHYQLIGNTVAAISQTFEADLQGQDCKLKIGNANPVFTDQIIEHQDGNQHRDPKCIRPFVSEAHFIQNGPTPLVIGDKIPATMNDSVQLCDDIAPVRSCKSIIKQAKPAKLVIGHAEVICGR